MEISLPRPRRLLLDMEASLPPSHGDRTGDYYYSSETNFDTNMVVVLAALLCALICALGLNSIVRCALSCSYRFSGETPEEDANPRLDGTTGLKKSALISQIPEVIYQSGIDILLTDCPICLGEFAEGEKLRVLPKCNHGFHVTCIDTWLWSHSSCPLCRQPLFDTNEEEGNLTVQLPGNNTGAADR